MVVDDVEGGCSAARQRSLPPPETRPPRPRRREHPSTPPQNGDALLLPSVRHQKCPRTWALRLGLWLERRRTCNAMLQWFFTLVEGPPEATATSSAIAEDGRPEAAGRCGAVTRSASRWGSRCLFLPASALASSSCHDREAARPPCSVEQGDPASERRRSGRLRGALSPTGLDDGSEGDGTVGAPAPSPTARHMAGSARPGGFGPAAAAEVDGRAACVEAPDAEATVPARARDDAEAARSEALARS